MPWLRFSRTTPDNRAFRKLILGMLSQTFVCDDGLIAGAIATYQDQSLDPRHGPFLSPAFPKVL